MRGLARVPPVVACSDRRAIYCIRGRKRSKPLTRLVAIRDFACTGDWPSAATSSCINVTAKSMRVSTSTPRRSASSCAREKISGLTHSAHRRDSAAISYALPCMRYATNSHLLMVRPVAPSAELAKSLGVVYVVATDEAHGRYVLVGDHPPAVVLLLIHPAVTVERLGEHRRHRRDRLRQHGGYCARNVKFTRGMVVDMDVYDRIP